MSEKLTGRVKWFNETKGFGFIEREGERDLFVHRSNIHTDGYPLLTEGQSVLFTIVDTPKGPQAENVEPQ